MLIHRKFGNIVSNINAIILSEPLMLIYQHPLTAGTCSLARSPNRDPSIYLSIYPHKVVNANTIAIRSMHWSTVCTLNYYY